MACRQLTLFFGPLKCPRKQRNSPDAREILNEEHRRVPAGSEQVPEAGRDLAAKIEAYNDPGNMELMEMVAAMSAACRDRAKHEWYSPGINEEGHGRVSWESSFAQKIESELLLILCAERVLQGRGIGDGPGACGCSPEHAGCEVDV